MTLPGRFEWKILGVVLFVAVLCAGMAAFALGYALSGMRTLSAEHQREIGGASARAAAVFRADFGNRKETFRRKADAIGARRPVAGGLTELEQEEDLLEARLVDEAGRLLDEWRAPGARRARLHQAPPVKVTIAPAGEEAARTLELTFGIPKEMYERFWELQRAIDLETERDRAFQAVVPGDLRAYLIAVVSILAIAPLIGLVVARRITRRLAELREAARRVGAGDLGVRLAPVGRDELDELARAFDRMVTELAEARSRLEYLQKVAAWQEVARRLAHEIKNPLTPIQLSVQQLVSKYQGDDPAYRRMLDTANEILHEEIAGLRRLVEDFSAFAKLPKVEPAPLDLGELVREVARQHPEWQDAVAVDVAGGPVTAACDRTLFRRVLSNLIENALQAAEGASRKPAVRLRVEARPERRRAAVIVEDNGPGVPPADRQRVFDPYVTTKEEGTGLGLAIVRKIVIDHGGDVSIGEAPAPLGGARFVVEIPA